jgi:hypothetical protein
MSPQGLRASPYLPKPECSTELNVTEQWITLAKQGKLGGNYGIPETNALRDGLQHAPGVKNGRVLVIGSENPWVDLERAEVHEFCR